MKCARCAIREGICIPVVVIPIKDYPTPGYLRYRGVLCQQCANAFTMKKYEDEYSSWYTDYCDRLRSVAKPAANPFPDDASFKWEQFILKPNWEPAPKEECFVMFWKAETLAAKGAKAGWNQPAVRRTR